MLIIIYSIIIFFFNWIINYPKFSKPLHVDDGNWFYWAHFFNKKYRYYQIPKKLEYNDRKLLAYHAYFNIQWYAHKFVKLFPKFREEKLYYFKVTWYCLTSIAIAFLSFRLTGNLTAFLLSGILWGIITGISNKTYFDMTYGESFIHLPLCLSIYFTLQGNNPLYALLGGILASLTMHIKIIAFPIMIIIAFFIPDFYSNFDSLGLFFLGILVIQILPLVLIACKNQKNLKQEINRYLTYTYSPFKAAFSLLKIKHKEQQSSSDSKSKNQDQINYYTQKNWESAGSFKQQISDLYTRFNDLFSTFMVLFLFALYQSIQSIILLDLYGILFIVILLMFLGIYWVQKNFYNPKLNSIWSMVIILSTTGFLNFFSDNKLFALTIVFVFLTQISKNIYDNFTKDKNKLAGQTDITSQLFTKSKEIGRFIKSNSSKNDRILVWGNFANIYLYADREAFSPQNPFLYPNSTLDIDELKAWMRKFVAPNWLVFFNYHTKDNWNINTIQNKFKIPYKLVKEFSIKNKKGNIAHLKRGLPLYFPLYKRDDEIYLRILFDQYYFEENTSVKDDILRKIFEVSPDNPELDLIKENVSIDEEILHKKISNSSGVNKALYQRILGDVFKVNGQYDLASNLYNEAFLVNHSDYRLYIGLGEISFMKGDLSNATKAFNKAIELNPFSAEAFNNLGVVSNALNNFETSKKCFIKALDLRPEYSEALNNLYSLENSR